MELESVGDKRMIFVGCIAFLFYVLYDINQCWLKQKFLQPCFFIGSLLLVAATGKIVIEAGVSKMTLFHGVALTLAVIFALLLIYTLFFAIPFEETYIEEQFNHVCKSGVYALCRHPGVLFLLGFYVFLSVAISSRRLLNAGLLFSLCNVVYVILQDKFFFPRCFDDYPVYQKEVPFLIPTSSSVKQCIRTWRK